MARFNPGSYAKNVLRSAGYIAAESIKGVNPTLTSYITETASSARDMYDYAKNFKRNFKEKLNSTETSESLKGFEKTKKNILDDIRTGKFYNPEREKKAFNEYIKKEGFSFDDLDFDVDENFGEDSESSSTEASAINNLSMTQQKLTAASTDEIVRSGRANTRMTIKSTNIVFGRLNNSLAVINSSILNLHQDLAKPLNNHIINSSNFYQVATSELAKQTSYLENINNILTERYQTKKAGFNNKSRYTSSPWEEIFGGGLPNLRKWGNHAKNKLMADSGVGFISDLLSPEMIEMMSTGALSSPIALIAQMAITDKLQSSKFGKGLNRTEDLITNGLANLASRFSAYSKGRLAKNAKTDKWGKTSFGFLDSIISAFDISPKANKRIHHDQYHRGPIDWDGESKRALTMVIPTQLARIEYALTGKEESKKIYDYKLGKWVTPKEASNQFRKDRKNAIRSGMSKFSNDITEQYVNDYNRNLAVGQAQMSVNSRGAIFFKQDFDEIMQALALSNVEASIITKTEYDRIIDGLIKNKIITRKNANKAWTMIQKSRGLANALNNGRVENNKFLAKTSADAGAFGAISNGSGLLKSNNKKLGPVGNTILGLEDDKGHNIYWYLQNFYSSFKAIEHNIINGSFGRGASSTSKRKNKWKNSNDFNVPLGKSAIDANKFEEARNRAKSSEPTYRERNGNLTDIRNSDGSYRKSSYNKTEREAIEEERSSIFTKAVDKLNDFLSDVLFGGKNIKQIINEGGLFKYIKDLPKMIAENISKLKDQAVDWAKDKWDKFKKSDFGRDYFRSMKDQVIGFGRSARDQAKDYMGQVAGWFSNRGSSNAANGGFVTKSGMISVSEGEMIIPSEMNPYYRGKTNKSSQRAKEAMNYRNWIASGGNTNNYWGNFSKGGYTDDTINWIREQYKSGVSKEQAIKNFKERFGGVNQNKFNTYWNSIEKESQLKSDVEVGTNNIKNKAKSGLGKAKDLGKRALDSDIVKNTLNKINNNLEQLFGKDALNTGKDIGKDAIDTVKKSLPQTMASGTIGAIIGGALTGSGLGLLGGLAVGAGIHIIKNSDNISKKLFGVEEIDEKGNRKMTGGLFSSKISTFIKKRFPSLAKSGAIGSVLGATGFVPGGLFGGFIIGAGIDYLVHTQTVKNRIEQVLFGNEDANGKRHGGVIDSLRLRVINPMADYVQDKLGKAGGYIKDAVLNPLKRLFDPLKDWVKGKGTKILEGIGNTAKSAVDKIFASIGSLFNSTFGRLFKFMGWSGDKLLGIGGNLFKLPFTMLGKAGDALNRHNINVGYSSASATNRVATMKGKASAYDKKLAELEAGGNIEAQKDFIDKINYYSGTVKDARNKLSGKRAELTNMALASLEEGGLKDPKAAKALRNAMKRAYDKKTKRTDYSQVINDIENGYLSGFSDENVRSELIKKLTTENEIIKNRELNLDNWESEQEKFFSGDEFKDYDLKGFGGKFSNKKLNHLKMKTIMDMKRLGMSKNDSWENGKENAEEKQNPKDKLKEDRDLHPLDSERNTLLGTIVDFVKKIGLKIGANIEDKSSWDEANESNGIPSKESKKSDNNDTSGGVGRKPGEKYRDSDGILYEVMENGDIKPDMSDEQTKKIIEERDKEKQEKSSFFTSITSFLTGGGLFAGISKLLGIGNKEEKKVSIFDKLKGLLGGAASAIGNITGIFKNGLGGLGSIVAKGIGDFIAGGGLKTALIAAGLGWLFTRIGKETEGTDKDYRVRKDQDPNELKSFKDMNPLEKIGFGMRNAENLLTNKNMTAYSKDDFVSSYTLDRAKGTMATNILTGAAFNGGLGKAGAAIAKNTIGRIPVVGKVFSAPLELSSKLGSALPKVKQSIATAAKKFSETSVGGKVADIAGKVAAKVKDIFNWIFNKLGVKSAGEAADEAAGALGEAVAEKGGSSLSSLLQNAALVIYVGKILWYVTDGFQSARAKVILGILEPPTFTQRLLAAALNGINAAIPGIGGIIPTEVLFNILYWIFDKFGIDLGGIKEQREAAKQTLEQYKEATGNQGATLEEYIHNELGEWTINERLLGGAKAAGKGLLKLGKGAVDIVAHPIKNAKAAASKVGEFATKAGSKLKDVGSSALTGIKNFGTSVIGKAKDIKDDAVEFIAGTKAKITNTINNIGEGIFGIFKKTKGIGGNVKKMVSEIFSKDSDTNSSNINSIINKYKSSGKDDIFASINNGIVDAVGSVSRLILNVIGPFSTIVDKVSGFGNKIGNAISSTGGAISNGWQKFKDGIGSIFSRSSGNSIGNDMATGTGSGVHVSQKGSKRRFGSSNVDENGCGPATAATVLRAYGRGGNLDDAVTWAEAGGYVAGASGVGTRASYFSDILGANGIRTSYTNSKNSIRGAVGSGNPTILLGQDSGNKSKANSPFGPNPHYVVARGSDSKGHVLIDDPELGAPAVYNKKILNKAKLGILTGGGSNPVKESDGAVWNYLKSAGLTDAGTAGLMGNLYGESGITFNKLEKLCANRLRETGKGNYTDESYTAAIDNGTLDKTHFLHPRYPDKNSSGKDYQYGYGLVQWTSPSRKEGLYDLVKSKGVSIADPNTQLEYLVYELKNKYPGVYKTLTTTNNLQEASDLVLKDFESPSEWQTHTSKRKSYGETYLNKFSANPPTNTSFGTTTASATSNTASGPVLEFPKYNLSEQQLKGAANIIQNEQGGIQGRYAEASLMANQVDMKDDSKANAENLIKHLKGGWFAKGATRYEEGFNGSAKIEPSALAAATDVFNNGKRTLPRYVDEHDCFADLAMINGKSTGLSKAMGFQTRAKNTPSWAKDRSMYTLGMPIRNVYGSDWKFSLFPDDKSDPFGYISDEMRQKHGEAHYTIDKDGNVTAPSGYSSGSGVEQGSAAAASSGASGGTNLSSILSSTFSKVFQAVGKGLSGAAASIFKLITGGFNSELSSNATSATSSSETTGTNTNGNIQTSIAGDSTPQYGGIAKSFPQGKGTPQSAVEIAQSQLGVVEGPEGSNNGNITDYGKFMGMDKQPWCASFVSWVMDKTFNGDKAARNKALRGGPDAAVSTLWSQFKSANAMTNSPQPGDVIIFKNNGASHTGLVETVNGNTITSIEGNTGSGNEYNRNGGVVARHKWTLGDGSSLDKKLTGFGRPDWGTGTGSGLPLYRFIGGKSAAGASSEYDYDDRDDGHAKPYPTGYGTPRSMIEIARSQLGVLEGGLGEKDKSGNWIPHSGNITDYGKFMGMDKQPWCASFVSWVMDKTFNGAKNKRNYALRGNPSAAVDGLWSNFKAAGEMHDIPEPGDVVIYKNDTSHTGIVETVNGKHITTIEGNTSSGNTFDRNGGIVFRKEFTIGDGSSMANKLTGFGRPNWNADKEFGTGSGLLYYYGGASRVSSLDKALKNGSYSNKYKNLNNSINTMQNIKATNRSSANFHKLDSAGMSEYNRRKAEKAWDDEQRAINETIARNKAAASWEADNEAIRKMQNENYAKAHSTSSRSSNGSSSGYSSSSSSSGSYYGSSAPVANAAGFIDATSLNSILEYLKSIAENTSNNKVLPTIVELIGKLAGVTAAVNSNSMSEASKDTVNNINNDIIGIIKQTEALAGTL